MITDFNLEHHFRPRQGWMNDPNGLVYYKGYYHAFYQHVPDHEIPIKEKMSWGHARTKDFITWEELPIAICPDMPYDAVGCYSGTAIVKDDVLYIFYASIMMGDDGKKREFISVAYSDDGINFQKYENNPVINKIPPEAHPRQFRDPAIMEANGKYYCVVAAGKKEEMVASLLLYESRDLLNWEYKGPLVQYKGCFACECPSFMKCGERYMLTSSVIVDGDNRYFTVMYGDFDGQKFTPEVTKRVHKGPDQYAGQAFVDHKGRNLFLTWIPGWTYSNYAERSLGCLSLPVEFKVEGDRITAYPIEEVRHLLKDSDPCLQMTDDGFVIKRTDRPDVVYQGEIRDIKVLRDNYIIEVYVNGGEEVLVAVLC